MLLLPYMCVAAHMSSYSLLSALPALLLAAGISPSGMGGNCWLGGVITAVQTLQQESCSTIPPLPLPSSVIHSTHRDTHTALSLFLPRALMSLSPLLLAAAASMDSKSASGRSPFDRAASIHSAKTMADKDLDHDSFSSYKAPKLSSQRSALGLGSKKAATPEREGVLVRIPGFAALVLGHVILPLLSAFCSSLAQALLNLMLFRVPNPK